MLLSRKSQEVKVQISSLIDIDCSFAKGHLKLIPHLIFFNTFYTDVSGEEQLAKAKVEQLELENAEKLTNSASSVASMKERVEHLQSELESTLQTLHQTSEMLSEQKHIHLQFQETVGVEKENQVLQIMELTQKQTTVEVKLTDALSRLGEAEKSLETSREYIATLEVSKEALDVDLQALTKKSSQQDKTIIKQGNQICDLEQVVSEKEAEIEEMKSHLDETEDQLSNSLQPSLKCKT